MQRVRKRINPNLHGARYRMISDAGTVAASLGRDSLGHTARCAYSILVRAQTDIGTISERPKEVI
jgi:hypothetical protein